jgi:hypothetical protein
MVTGIEIHPRQHRDQPRQQRDACRVERVRDAVREQRVDPRPRRDDLEPPDIARCRIARACRLHVAAQLPRDPCKLDAGHDQSVAPNRPSS